jgi:hypothetical protein
MPNSPITVNLGYSNYAKGVVGGNGQSPGAINQVPAGSDQTTTPGFVNAAGGDFRGRASSSGTVDRGHDDGSVGPVDLNGDPRVVGSAPDIGAYEHQPPTVTASANPASIASSTPATFSASGTPSIPGDSLSYVWHFDDGATASGPTVGHGFAAPGSHVGTVTVSDASGLTATATAHVTVTPAKLSALRISPHKVSLAGRQVKGRCVKPTARNAAKKRCRRPITFSISYRLNAPARVTVSLTRSAPGRRVNGRCVKPTKRNGKHSKCTRLVSVPGKIVQSGKAGPNHVTFSGRIGGHKLGPGTYELTASPSGGRSTETSFTIAR